MKLIIRIFNILIMAMSVAAGIFLFMPPAFSFNSKVTLNVKTFSDFVPETEYSKDINIAELLGTDSIYVGIKFKLDVQGIADMKDGNKEKIDDTLIADNITDMIALLHEPVDLITDFFIRANMKKIITEQVTNYVDQAVESYRASQSPSVAAQIPSSQEIMDDVGINEEYFLNFSYALYDECNSDGATIDSANGVLIEQVNEALTRAEDSGAVDTSVFGDEQKASVKTSLTGVLTSLNLVQDDGVHLKKISEISYLYLAEYLKGELSATYDAASLAQKPGETIPAYADRLLDLYVRDKMPDIFYKIVGYVSLGLFIGLFVFAAVWGLLLVITLLKTFTKKPWTIFGFWFWLVGLVQLVLGFGLTWIARFALEKFDISKLGLPISDVLVSIKTYALVPSIIFLASIVVGIVYAILRGMCKAQVAAE